MKPVYATSPSHQPPADEPTTPDNRTWSITTTGGLTLTGYLPPWADEDPSDTNVPLEKLSTTLIDLTHWQPFDGQTMHVHPPAHADGNSKAGEGVDTLFNGNITCYSYSEDLRERTPYVNVHVVDDFWMNKLTPDDLTHLATQLRAQADRLDNEIRPALIAARTDWETHHSQQATDRMQPPANPSTKNLTEINPDDQSRLAGPR
ncbi:hypothetical protein GA0115240_139217 [Streptomyces sp. DvalAA-14]|uniref:DUF6907 domain-containing protein n=1 Tax=unclassified Streptomyces TaxID=2593676 RepID=UPI00081B165B|nr:MULTISPECIES: hypothetical protein [unclassified Streptomyces]MYS22235.1 hypothetical protein [Streptomyces sp. SID4948]SCE11781.1 hypothetical protein GA0115240_139217 [Streptomyces sp. DvalAA-14]